MHSFVILQFIDVILHLYVTHSFSPLGLATADSSYACHNLDVLFVYFGRSENSMAALWLSHPRLNHRLITIIQCWTNKKRRTHKFPPASAINCPHRDEKESHRERARKKRTWMLIGGLTSARVSSEWNRNAISCRFKYCQATEAMLSIN